MYAVILSYYIDLFINNPLPPPLPPIPSLNHLDHCLHDRALSEGLLSDLLELLHSIPLCHKWEWLHIGPHPQGGRVQQEWMCLLKPCLDCLNILATCSSEVRQALSKDYSTLATIFQGELYIHLHTFALVESDHAMM